MRFSGFSIWQDWKFVAAFQWTGGINRHLRTDHTKVGKQNTGRSEEEGVCDGRDVEAQRVQVWSECVDVLGGNAVLR